MSVQSVLENLVAIQEAISGVERAYANPPKTISDHPCFVNVLDSGSFERYPGQRVDKHRIKMMLFVQPSKSLPDDEDAVRPFVSSVPDKFDTEMTITSAVTYSAVLSYKTGILQWGETFYAGVTFELEATDWNATTFEE